VSAVDLSSTASAQATATAQAEETATAVHPEPAAGTTRTLEKAGIVMVYVPAGEFLMGSSDSDPQAYDDEKPQHTVYLDGYWIGQTEVTNAQFSEFIEDGGYSKSELWTEDGWRWKREHGVAEPGGWEGYSNRPEHPVVNMTWYEAAAYAEWAGARLPTEAEWEKAARGGPKSQGYLYAGGDDVAQVAWYEWNSGEEIHPVAGKQANELGVYDMSGNVWEYCTDWYDDGYYGRSPGTDPQGPASGTDSVVRGGSRFNSPRLERCATRAPRRREYGSGPWTGFRVVASALDV